MILDNGTEHTEDALLRMNELLPQSLVERFTYALENRIRNEEEVVKFLLCVRNSHSYALVENSRLKRWAPDFNKEYATDHNTYFAKSEAAMSQMRSTLEGISNALFKFCYVDKEPLPAADGDVPALLERSPMIAGVSSPDMFGNDSYGKALKMLYDEVLAYLHTAMDNVDICISVMAEERYIRQHPEETVEVFATCQERTARQSRSVITRLMNSDEPMENSMLDALEKAENTRQLIAEMFHMLNVNEWVDFVVCKECSDARNKDLTPLERELWGKGSLPKVVRVRTLLEHLGDLEMEGKIKRGDTLSGWFVMRLMFWCQIQDESRHATLLDYITSHYKGSICRIDSVKAAKVKRSHLSNADDLDEQLSFNQAVDSFIDLFLPAPRPATAVGY